MLIEIGRNETKQKSFGSFRILPFFQTFEVLDGT